MRADLLVISGDDDDPYRDLIEAGSRNVRLVLVGGVPVYGDASVMRAFWEADQLQPIDVGGPPRAVAGPAANFSFTDVVSRLEAALQAEGMFLAALTEAGGDE